MRRLVLAGDDNAEAEAEVELDALQNAEVLAGAEHYYRTMVRTDAESWNVRDCHMSDTLDRRYDALLSFEDTTALSPLRLEPAVAGGEQETKPWGT